MSRKFPLRLAYSMTYNKSQGQELKRCLVDIRSPPFVHGHLYVSLSRIRYFDNIRIFCTDDNIENNCIIIKNYIYNQLKI
jgi:ATP-dependent exoDNAse (exonuclease V) alpha subunit